MGRNWTTHHINEYQSAESLRELIKQNYGSKYRINELRFKTKDLRVKFQSEILNGFVDEYSKSDLQHQVDTLHIYTTPQDKWVTPYGEIVLKDIETLKENGEYEY